MSDDVKISKAFDPFMADSGPNDKRDAIVIYRAPQDGNLPSASKDPTDRLNYVKVRADRQRKVHASVVEAYQREGPRRLARRLDLSASSVGSDVLPISQVEVTTRTLPALAEQPDVVAILPNQKLHPLEPRVVDYRAANKAESNAGLTWGLKTLGIPELWNTTKGEQINVAVLDTGVHGHHPLTKPDVVAPGVRVYSCIPPEKRPQGGVFEYSYMDGSSMASPHVAGVAALLMAAHRNATVSDIARVLKETARHPGGHGSRPDNRWGYGMIQPQEALGALSS